MMRVLKAPSPSSNQPCSSPNDSKTALFVESTVSLDGGKAAPLDLSPSTHPSKLRPPPSMPMDEGGHNPRLGSNGSLDSGYHTFRSASTTSSTPGVNNNASHATVQTASSDRSSQDRVSNSLPAPTTPVNLSRARRPLIRTETDMRLSPSITLRPSPFPMPTLPVLPPAAMATQSVREVSRHRLHTGPGD